MPLWPLCAAILGRMLDSFPIGQRTAAGDVFWSGTKRVPVALTFSAADPAHLSFVVAAANLRAAAYGLRGRRDSEFHVEALEGLAAEQEHEQEQERRQQQQEEEHLPEVGTRVGTLAGTPPVSSEQGEDVQPRREAATNHAGGDARGGSGGGDTTTEATEILAAAASARETAATVPEAAPATEAVTEAETAREAEAVAARLPPRESLAGYRLSEANFVTRDPLHAAFVAAAASCRAQVHRIPRVGSRGGLNKVGGTLSLIAGVYVDSR